MSITCFLRVDANNKIGFGHLSRCRIIAKELKNKSIRTVFLMRETDIPITKMLAEQDFEFKLITTEGPENIIQCMQEYTAMEYILIFDTDLEIYYTESSQSTLLKAGFKLVFFTFWDQYTYYAHIIINQNPRSITHQYHTAGYTRKLLGPDYMIFDDQFIDKSDKVRIANTGNRLNIFLSFGGADLPDTTSTAVEAIESLDLPVNKIHVVIGALYQYEEKLYRILERSRFQWELYKQIGNISEVMQHSDIAVCSGGLTLWELAVLKVPTAVISYSEREKLTASYLDNKEYTFHIGSANALNKHSLCQQLLRFANSEALKNRTFRLSKIINVHGKFKIIDEIIALVHDQ